MILQVPIINFGEFKPEYDVLYYDIKFMKTDNNAPEIVWEICEIVFQTLNF